MGTINSNGIFVYDDTESLSPLSSYMNLQGSALSTRLGQDVRFKKVANEAARTAYVNEVGIANISAANPLAVHRQNAPEGLRFEVTYNGTTWDPFPSKSYLDAQAAANDTGWQPITPLAGFTGIENLGVRRIGKQVFIRGAVQRTSGPFPTSWTTVCNIPVGFRPGYYFRVPGTTYAAAAARGSEWSVATGGDLVVGSIGPGTDIIRLNSSWLID